MTDGNKGFTDYKANGSPDYRIRRMECVILNMTWKCTSISASFSGNGYLIIFFSNRPLIHSQMTQRHPGSQTKFSDTVGSFHRKNCVVNFLSAFVYFLTLWIISLFSTFARHFFLSTKISIISQLFVKHSRLCLLMGFFKWNCGWSTKEVYLGQEQLLSCVIASLILWHILCSRILDSW